MIVTFVALAWLILSIPPALALGRGIRIADRRTRPASNSRRWGR